MDLINRLGHGKTRGVLLDEFMQVSFLTLMHGDTVHIEVPVVYGGQLFELHACVSKVTTHDDPDVLTRMM